MKRAKLVKGQKVALKKGKNWGYSNPNLLEIEEVEVVSTDPYDQNGSTPLRVYGGNGVLVIRKRGYEDVVQLGMLLGPWDDVKAEQDGLLKKEGAVIDTRMQGRAEFSKEVSDYALVNHLETLCAAPSAGAGKVTISFDELKKLVERLEARDPHYT